MSLYSRHLQTLIKRYTEACEQFQLDTIIIHSGSTTYYPGDDSSQPFHPFPMAQQWLPYDLPPETWIVFSPNTGLRLFWPAKQDFWHVLPEEPSGDWTADWAILPFESMKWLNKSGIVGSIAIFSSHPEHIKTTLPIEMNPPPVLNWLNYDRAYKSQWEIENIRVANQRATLGHMAAQTAFLEGRSEFDIHLAYLAATQQQQIDEPYSSIVGLNESAAVLHYEKKRRSAPDTSRTLLIDAGAKVNGYASDITRTFTHPNSPFAELVTALDTLEQQLVSLCSVGTDYLSIHNKALELIAGVLKSSGICRLSVEEQLTKKIPQVFFPHGIGHLLGLQVHDLGGLQIDQQGTKVMRPDHAPLLRLMRPLEEGMVVTIEPGFYFIPMLLDKMKNEIPDHGCDLALIDTLRPYGGIRVEDNVVIQQEGPLNLTRNSFNEL